MRTYVFDLDGTLMPSHAVDNQCYWQAVEQVFDCVVEDTSLNAFSNVTDNGILAEWTASQYGREPRSTEVSAVRSAFLALIRQANQQDSAAFTPRVGLLEWIARATDKRHQLAIATGGWLHTARFKLQCAGLDRFRLPLAASDHAADRIGIMQAALAQLKAAGAVIDEEPTYVGDAPWDLEAANQLGWSFVGIASGERADLLQEAGAVEVHEDFLTFRQD